MLTNDLRLDDDSWSVDCSSIVASVGASAATSPSELISFVGEANFDRSQSQSKLDERKEK